MERAELARRIIEIIRREQAQPGFHLREKWLADSLGVSRSPVRGALRDLEALGVVRSERHHGVFLALAPDSPEFAAIDLPESEFDRLYQRVASARFANLIDDQISVSDLMRRFQASRALVLKVLRRLQEEGLVEKTPGHDWFFRPALNDEDAFHDSYRYRLLIEPAALREPGFALPARQAKGLRAAHDRLRATGAAPAAFVELDSSFHVAMAEACGNRFLAQAISRQTRLRELSEHRKYASAEGLRVAIDEHLAVLDAIEDGRLERAAIRMAAHIENAEERRPDFRKVRVLAHRRMTRI